MPLFPASHEPDHVSPETENAPDSAQDNPSAGAAASQPEPGSNRPAKIRTARFGELDEHELIHLLDTIEDERARGRFRESIYISMFIWMVVVWVALYGPRYLWHAPRIINPMDVLKARELTELADPHLRLPRVHLPKPLMKMDNKTLESIRKMTPPTPPPPAPTPTPTPPTPTPTPPPPTPQPSHATTPVVEAPSPQPHVNFPSAPNPSDSLKNAIRGAGAPGTNVGTGMHAPGGADIGGGVEVLSDMQGVDFSAWLRRMHDDVQRNWEPLLPLETEAPILKQGESYIRIKILPDGTIADMHLDGSSHDQAIDKSCWGSITSEGQFPPLPRQFHGPYLELRLHYMVNKRFQ
jgi:hypothetical protein